MKGKKSMPRKASQPKPQAGQVQPQESSVTIEEAATKIEPTVVRAATLAQEPLSSRDRVMICLYSVLLFVAMTIQTGQMAMIFTALALVLSIGKDPLKRFGARLCVPVIGLLAFALMNGLAAIYSSFGDYAVGEYYKFLTAFALAVILLARFEKKHVRGLLWGAAAVCAVISLLCVDLGSWGVLFHSFNTFAEAFGSSYASLLENSASLRVNGIYNDANITGALLGPAILVSLYLSHTEADLRKRAIACVLVGMNAVGFLIAMSRGAILCFGLAALVYLAAERQDRLSLFFLMLSTAVSLAITGGFAMMHMQAGDILPDVMLTLCGVLIFLLDWAVGNRVANLLKGHGVAVAISCTAVVLLAIGFGFVALNQNQEPYTFENDSSMLYRSLALEPGNYTISGDWDGAESTTVYIYSRSREEVLTTQATVLYNGPLSEALFTVPENSIRVFFQVRSETYNAVREIALSDGTALPLAYKWLPEMIANRLQDSLSTSSSYLLRVQFDVDAWKLFKQSPLIGHGLGSTEGLYTSVQPFFYESLYVHNHILQVMSDMGLLGLIAFLTLLGGSLWLLIQAIRKERDPLAAVLLACWVMMNSHSLMEINFSIRAFQCVAYLLLLLPVLLYAQPLSKKAAKWGGFAVAGCFWAYLLIFGGLMERHRMVAREAAEFSTSDAAVFMETLRSFVSRDVFDHEQYQLTFVGNAVLMDTPLFNGSMEKYVQELRDSGTYTACSGLARYYYLPRGEFEELFACSREGIAQEASAKDAWNLQLNFYRTEVLPAAAEQMDVFMDGVTALNDYLAEYSQGRLEDIQLTEENQAFLNMVTSAKETGISGETAYLLLMSVSNSEDKPA